MAIAGIVEPSEVGGRGRTLNLRRRKPADLQSAPFATRDTLPQGIRRAPKEAVAGPRGAICLAAVHKVNRKAPNCQSLVPVTEPRDARTPMAGQASRPKLPKTGATPKRAATTGAAKGATLTPRSSSMAGIRILRRSPTRRAASAAFDYRKRRTAAGGRGHFAAGRPGNGAARRDRGAAFAGCRASGAARGGRSPPPRLRLRSSAQPASCWCSTSLPIRTMSGPLCAPRRRLPSAPSSPPRVTARKRPACWRSRPRAHWNSCRWLLCRTLRARSRR